MRRLLPSVALLALAAAPALGAEAGEAREVKEKNFRWTLPSKDWAFSEVAADLKGNGYVLRAACSEDGGLEAFARVVPANNLKTSEAAEEMRNATSTEVQKVAQASVTTGRLSGIDGSLAIVRGTAASGGSLWFRGYAIVQGGMLHQLLIRAYNGAEAKRADDVDALRRGYRLLKGAGPEEASTAPEVHATPDEGAGGAGGAPATWPASGPKREGGKITFPSHNLVWTIPEGSPFEITGVTENEKQDKGELLILAGRLPRKTPGAGEPTDNHCRVVLFSAPLTEGQTANAIVNAPNVQGNLGKAVFQGKNDASKTKIQTDQEVGNAKGGRLTLVGLEEKTYHYFILQVVTLKKEQYEWHLEMRGGKEITQEFGSALGALFKGVQFMDVTEGVRGPTAVPGIPTFNAERGHSKDKELEITVPGLTATKPKGVTAVPFEGGADPALRLVWEARSADDAAYLYFDVRTYDVAEMQRAKKEPKDLVGERETQWRTGGGEDAITVTKGKEASFDAAFGAAKGTGWRFTGSQGGHPFVETGWVVKAKSNYVVLRAQFGGANAEKTLEGLFKAIRKGVKFPS